MDGSTLWHALEASDIGTAVRESSWLFPIIETVHVFALVLVVGSIARVDLRLLGVRARSRTVSAAAAEWLPWTWSCFVLALGSGLLMFCSAAQKYADNLPFRIKLGLLALAGINMLVFQTATARGQAHWDSEASPPPAAKLAGAISLTLWIGVVTAGRWIGYIST